MNVCSTNLSRAIAVNVKVDMYTEIHYKMVIFLHCVPKRIFNTSYLAGRKKFTQRFAENPATHECGQGSERH